MNVLQEFLEERPSMSVTLAVVPVAGKGTRLLPLTRSVPKELLPVGRKPVLQLVIEELARSRISRVVLVNAPGKPMISAHFAVDHAMNDGLRRRGKTDPLLALKSTQLAIQYTNCIQEEQLGLGHAVLCARATVGAAPFVVALGDTLIGVNSDSNIVKRMMACFVKQRADAVVAFENVAPEKVSRYGIAQPKGQPGEVFELEDIVEKPAITKAPSTLAVAARYVFSPDIFGLLATTKPGKDGEIQLTDAIRALIRGGGKVLGMRLRSNEMRFDIGNFPTYFQTFCEFALADPQFGPDLRSSLRKLLNTRSSRSRAAQKR